MAIELHEKNTNLLLEPIVVVRTHLIIVLLLVTFFLFLSSAGYFHNLARRSALT